MEQVNPNALWQSEINRFDDEMVILSQVFFLTPHKYMWAMRGSELKHTYYDLNIIFPSVKMFVLDWVF